jgi:hypothetical protein
MYFMNLPRPCWYGYEKVHHTRDSAERAAYRSRQAFHALAGMCSYTIAMCSGNPDLPCPDWVTHLQTWIHPGWLEDLRTSVVGRVDSSVRRRGALVDPENCPWAEDILFRMILTDTPVWFLWKSAKTVEAMGSNFFSQWKPASRAQVREKLALLDLTDSSTPAPIAPSSIESQLTGSSSFTFHTTHTADTLPTTVDLDLDPVFPLVEPGSRQRRGQDWQTFFERQDRRHEQLYRNATDQQLQVWASRKRDNEYGSAPGRSGAVVWEWVDVDGFFIRQRVERARVEDVFYAYAPTQKRYNPIEREWDLHYEFDPTAIPDDDDDDNNTVYNEPLPPPVPVDGLSDNDITQRFIDDMEGSYGRMEELLLGVELQILPLLDVLRHRYGLIFDGTLHNIPVPADTKPLSQRKLQSILLSADLRADERSALPMTLFIDLMSRRSFAMTEAPSLRRLWDLSRCCGNPLIMDESPPFCRVWRMDGQNRDLFVVSGLDSSPVKWDMLLEHPLTVLECRRWFHLGTPKRDIILHFIRTGTPFIRVIDVTKFNSDSFSAPRILPPDLLPGWRQPLFIADDERNSLGCRWPGYKPNHADYVSYWAKLVAFLQGPRGHLAAVMGGIIWRLAVQALGLEDVCRMVISGTAYRSPASVCYRSGRVHHHYDELETLSSPELDFITGTYYVYTDKGLQTAKQSWWPPHHTWRQSGRDMGHWTQAAEEWFCRRLAAIAQDPAAVLRTPLFHASPPPPPLNT